MPAGGVGHREHRVGGGHAVELEVATETEAAGVHELLVLRRALLDERPARAVARAARRPVPRRGPITMPGVGNVTVAGGSGAASATVQNGWSSGAASMANAFMHQYGEPAELYDSRHPAVVVAVADREHAVAVADRSRAPPPEVAQRETAHRRPVEGVDVGQGERTPEAALRQAVGQAPAERERAAVGREPVLELGCETIARARRSARRPRGRPDPDAARTSP